MDNYNEKLYKAFTLYKDDITTIDMISDCAYISVTQYAHLLNTILDINCIKPSHINELLLNIGAITISNSPFIKYDASDKVLGYCKKKQFKKGYFYIWDPRLLFYLFKIYIYQPITKSSVEPLISAIKPYVFTKLDKTIVYNNLILLQVILAEHSESFVDYI